MIYVPGYESDLAANDYSDIKLGENEYLGVSSNGMGGDIVVKVTIVDGVIEKIDILQQNETPEKFAPVETSIPAAVIAAQSTEIDVISGSTISSAALLEAIQNAIDQSK